MAALKNKEDLDAAIVRCFQQNTEANKLHVTPDGQCFLEKNKSFSELHARKNGWNVKTVDREDYKIPSFERIAKEKADKVTSTPLSDRKTSAPLTSTPLSDRKEPVKDYDVMTVPALKAELIEKKIVFSNKDNKAKLIALITNS